MKFLVLCSLALSYVAMAQNIVGGPGDSKPFHGVTIGGTLYSPTIKNPEGNQPVMGVVAIRHTDNGVDEPLLKLDMTMMTRGTFINGGTEHTLMGLGAGVHMEYTYKNATTGEIFTVAPGNTTSFELIGVLFADGTFDGTDIAFNGMAGHYAKVRSVARAIQVMPDKYAAMENRPSMNRQAQFASLISGDNEMINSRSAMTRDVLRIRSEGGDDEADKALARVASLPDMVKGE